MASEFFIILVNFAEWLSGGRKEERLQLERTSRSAANKIDGSNR
jgi:hypothetical protein